MRAARRSIEGRRSRRPESAMRGRQAVGTRAEKERRMTNIVAGRFELQADADAATSEFLREGFKRSQVSSFFLSTPGQHGRFPVGGDRNVSPGARGAATGAVGGAATGAVGGAALGALAGLPIGILAS